MSSLRKLVCTAALLSLAGFGHAQNNAASAAAAAPAAPASATVTAPAAATPASAEPSEGKLAFYSSKFNGRKTASGERFNSGALTMAHKTLPFGTRVKVTNLATKRSVIVRVNDRGPFNADRVGDVSLAAARQLHMLRSGVVNAKLEVVGSAPMHKAKGKHASKGKARHVARARVKAKARTA